MLPHVLFDGAAALRATTTTLAILRSLGASAVSESEHLRPGIGSISRFGFPFHQMLIALLEGLK